MSQLTQISGISDIISDVDGFIEENGITEDVGQLMYENTINSKREIEEEELKPTPEELLYEDINYPLVPNYPPDQPHDLCNDDYPGPYSFEVYVIPNEQKTPWEYSPKLNKIYILTNVKFPIAFSLKCRPNVKLFVRATPIFSQAQYFQEIVQRCLAHRHPQDPLNRDFPEHIFRHIVRCTNENTQYCGNADDKSRFNLIIPLSTPQAGCDLVKELFYFVCQNSCPQGMNRRPIELVFTLEDQHGEVFGRKIVNVRVCKCPKRDKEKEERDVEKNVRVPRGNKKRMLNDDDDDDDVDTRPFSLKDVVILGRKNKLQVLKYCQDLMAAEIVKMQNRNCNEIPFRKCHNDLNALINKTRED